MWERLVLPVERGGGAGRDRSEGVAGGSMPKAGLSAVQTGWLVANVPLYTHIKKDKAAHKHGAYSAKALQMADEIGFMNFLGNKQLGGLGGAEAGGVLRVGGGHGGSGGGGGEGGIGEAGR